MDRKDFLKKAALGATGLAIGGAGIGQAKASTYDKLMEQVGFNHLPNAEETATNIVVHRANTRGHADHGWLNAHHSFSFANYYNPDRMNFGVLRVLNDDIIKGGRGFSTHPHDNMEIVTIPLSGDLEHKDNMGNSSVIKQGDVQCMSAGTGIYHSEFNANKDQEVKLLQIWLFPNKRDVTPRYGQISPGINGRRNKWQQVVSPSQHDDGVWLHQDTWFNLGDLDADTKHEYKVHLPANGVYAFIISGSAKVAGITLNERDGMGMWDRPTFTVEPNTRTEILLMEVPMKLG